MKRTAALRVTGEICFYFAILTLFAAFQRWQLPMAGFALSCLIVGLVAVGLRSAPLRFVLSLLPGVCFLFSEMHWLLIFPALAWFYFVLYLGFGRFDVALYDYRQAFRWMLIVCAFVLMIQTINSMLFDGLALSSDSLIYLAAFVLLEVVAMRGMQMGAAMDGRWHAVNALTIVAALLVAVGVSLLLYRLYLLSWPVLVFLTAPLKRFLAWLFGLIRFRPAQEAPAATAPPETPPTNLLPSGLPVHGAGRIMEEDNLESVSHYDAADQALSIGAFLILAVLLLVAIWLVVKLARRGKALAQADVDYEQTEDFTPARGRRKARTETVHGRAQTVRKLYRDYLDYLKANGLQRAASDTSEEILYASARISEASVPAEQTLRRVYLKARYSAATVTDADVAAARQSLDAIRGREKT